MSWFYRRILRPALFTQTAETAHERTIRALAWAARHRGLQAGLRMACGADPLPVERFGLRFPNPVGLAAGMDKHASAVPAWNCLGFGFAELGAVTWNAQPGNPQPRVFRAIGDQAIINRMGFNNHGAEAFLEELNRWRSLGLWPEHPVGVNLGKSKITPLDGAAAEYAATFRLLRSHLDFFVVNVSSPNTPNLRQLQDKAALDEILAAVQESNQPSPSGAPKPLLVKVAPDLSLNALDEILELALARGISGLVATNTTLSRPEHPAGDLARVYAEAGGLSGAPLRDPSTRIIRHLFQRSQGRMPIIGVGGIFSAEDAWEKLTAGACLVQVYTGLVYEGPGLARAIVRGLRLKLREAGLPDLAAAVGTSSQ